jgi:TonB family protein
MLRYLVPHPQGTAEKALNRALDRTFIVGMVALTIASATLAQITPGADDEGVKSPLLQVVHIKGDQYVGFRESCLILAYDGRYRWEVRQQENIDGHPQALWEPPAVFEGAISTAELHELMEKFESKSFRAVTGTIGDAGSLFSRLSLDPLGVTPHADVEIFEASIAHSGSPQVFEVFGSTNHRNVDQSLRSFVQWEAEIEKRKEGRLNPDVASGCATSSSPGTWVPTTYLVARTVYAPAPEYPAEQRAHGQTQKVLVRAVINSDGTVGRASVKRGANPVLDQNALDAVRKWRFAPARLNGVAIATPMELEIRFNLPAATLPH